jgi:hypothetical protein
MPASDAQYQHFVPQLHLRGFSPNPRPARNARIWQLDKETGEVEEKRVARVGGEKRFYRAKGADEKYTNGMEAWLGIVEHYAAPALQRLISTRSRPDYADRLTIAFYLALQAGRTPHAVKVASQTSKVVFDAHLALWTHESEAFAEMCRDAGIEETREAIEDLRQRMRQPGYIQMADPRTEALRVAVETSDELTNTIAPMRWTLLRSDQALLVGDHPITHHHPEPPLFPWTEPAWRSSPTAESFIPLTTDTVLKMTHAKHRSERVFYDGTLRVAEADELNLHSYGWATRYVFAEDEATLREVRERADADPSAVPRPSRQFQVLTADERAFRRSEPNAQPEGWPHHVPRRGQNGELEWCRYKVVANDRPDEIREATEWALRAERRLHPGARPSLEPFSRDEVFRLTS